MSLLGASVCLVVYIHGKNSKEKFVRFGSMLCSLSYSSFFRQMKVKTTGILTDKWEKKKSENESNTNVGEFR